jgi:outer membrane protein assembly factor BamB
MTAINSSETTMWGRTNHFVECNIRSMTSALVCTACLLAQWCVADDQTEPAIAIEIGGHDAGHSEWSFEVPRIAEPKGLSVSGDAVFFSAGPILSMENDEEILGGSVFCVSADTGELRWQSFHRSPTGDWWVRPSYDASPNPPTADGDRVVFMTNFGDLVCADTAGFHDGENDGPVVDEAVSELLSADIVWEIDLVDDLHVYRAGGYVGNPIPRPLIHDEIVYVITGNGCCWNEGGAEFVPAPDAPAFMAVDLETGDVLWSDASPGKNTTYAWASPAVRHIEGSEETEILFPGGDNVLYAYSIEQGAMSWSLDVSEERTAPLPAFGLGDRSFPIGPPLLNGNDAICVLSQDTYGGDPSVASVVCVEMPSGDPNSQPRLKWRFTHDDFWDAWGPAVLFQSHVVVHSPSTGMVFALDPETGTVASSFESELNAEGRPALVVNDEVLYVPCERIHMIRDVSTLGSLGSHVMLELPDSLIGTPVFDRNQLYVGYGSRGPGFSWTMQSIDLSTFLPETED